MKQYLYLVFYDIKNDRIRTKTADALEQYGYERIQYSVFLGLENPRSLPALWNKLQTLIKIEEFPDDRVYVLRLRKSYFRNMKIIGKLAVDLDYLLGEQHTLVI